MKNLIKTLAVSALLISSACACAQPRIVKIESPKMTVYLPAESNGKAVLGCPGGGYIHLAAGHEGHNWAPYFNDLGFAFAVLEYNMPKGDREIPLTDARNAYKLLADSAASWGFSPEKIGIMGSSAGGHLAASVATHPTETCKPAFQILFYPVISLDAEITHKGTRNGFLGENPAPELVKEWSSENKVNAATPPAIMLLSADDKAVVPMNSLRYFNALTEAAVPATMHIYPTGGHGWGNRKNFKHHTNMMQDLTDWLINLE